MNPRTRPTDPEAALRDQRRRLRDRDAESRRLTRLRAAYPFLVEGLPEFDDAEERQAAYEHEHRECGPDCTVTGDECPDFVPFGTPILLDYGPWDPEAEEWGPDAPQRFQTEAEAIDRLHAELARPGSDWSLLQVRKDGEPGPRITIDPELAARFARIVEAALR